MEHITIAPPASYSPDYKSLPPAPQVPGAGAPSKIAGPVGSLALAACSLPASSAEVLRWLAKRESYYHAEAAKYMCEILAGRAEECSQLAKGLRRQMGYADIRQPEENAEVSHGRAKP